MKTRITFIAVLIVSLAGTFHVALAKEKQSLEKTTVAVSMKAENSVVIKGIVKKSESGLSLYDGKETYLLKGDIPLVEMIGKIVQIDGSLEKNGSDSILIVKQVVEAN